MTSAADTRLRGMALLVLYDVAFVVPLVAVFAAVYLGVRSESVAAAFGRHVAAGKIALGLFFAALGGLMIHAELNGF
jgi:cytochrome c biogenesis protein CcdA